MFDKLVEINSEARSTLCWMLLKHINDTDYVYTNIKQSNFQIQDICSKKKPAHLMNRLRVNMLI